MNNMPHFLIRISAFLRKEIFEILRQPRLAVTLVGGPFLILALFGIGYQNKPEALRTLFYLPKGSVLTAQEVKDYATTLGPQLIYAGLTEDKAAAIQKLREGKVDVVVQVPSNAYQTIQASQQAVFILYNDQIDPFQIQYVQVFGKVYVEEINHRILERATQQGQNQASTAEKALADARAQTDALRQALANNNPTAASAHQGQLKSDLARVAAAVDVSAALLNSLQQTLGGNQNDPAYTAAQNKLDQIRHELNALNQVPSGSDLSSQTQQLTQLDNNLTQLQSNLKEFQSISPNVLVSPFRSEAQTVLSVQPRPSDFFGVSVIVLLLQHVAVTFASLSIVQENTVGALELFRVSPLSPGETLLGKYLSYMLFLGLLALVLTLLLIFGLGMPLLGSLFYYALVLAALVFASLGFGFIISLLAETDTQAVQYAMIILLTSVFFSGLFMGLEQIWQPVRIISWAMPATYGAAMLRNIMLRGRPPDPELLGGLAAMGAGLFVVAWLLLQRKQKHP
jgi:ABC-2 type transport system permease protein